MPEILRNLTVARFSWRLGIKMRVGKFKLDFDNSEICNNSKEQPLAIKADYNQKIGSRKRVFSVVLVFSQTSIFRHRYWLCLQISHLRKRLVYFLILSYNISIL